MSCFLIAQNMTYIWRDSPWDRQSLSDYQPFNQLDGSNSSGGPAQGSPQETWWETPWFILKQLEPQLVFWVWLLNRKDLQPRKEWLPVEDKMVTKLMHKAASMLSILEWYGWYTVGFRVWNASRRILFESIGSGWIRMDLSLLQKIGASTDPSCILLSTVDSGIRPRSQGAKKHNHSMRNNVRKIASWNTFHEGTVAFLVPMQKQKLSKAFRKNSPPWTMAMRFWRFHLHVASFIHQAPGEDEVVSIRPDLVVLISGVEAS